MKRAPTNNKRRAFIKAGGSLAGGLVLGFHLPVAALAAKAPPPAALNAWVKIASDDTITIFCARSEMGQGVYTSMPMLVAEELEVDLARIKVEFAPVGVAYRNALLGGQMTDASTSVRDAWEKLRQAGACARLMLVAAAAQQWNVDVAQCRAVNGAVLGPGRKKATYGQLAVRAAMQTVPSDIPLKQPAQFRLIGNPKQRRLDTPAKARGQAVFGIDVRVPGMLCAAVAMSPTIGGKVASFDDTRARAIPGIKAVVQYSRGVAVVADSWWQAKKGRDVLQIRWDPGPGAAIDQQSIWESLRTASDQPGVVIREQGQVDDAMGQSAQTLVATYRLPFLAHATMEPQNALADVRPGHAIIYAPTQFQELVPHAVAAATGLKPEQVVVQTPFLGGGGGRRVEVDYVVDAAEISKAMGAPVKLIWSREDDMTHDVYVPASIVKLAAGVDAGGRPAAMSIRATCPPIAPQLLAGILADDANPATALTDDFPYAIPHLRVACQMQETGVTTSSSRTASPLANALAFECFIDELANAAAKDALNFRIEMLDTPANGESAAVAARSARLKRVLEQVRTRSGWGKQLQGTRGMGVAAIDASDTAVAVVVQAFVSPTFEVTIEKVSMVADAGLLLHPDQAQAQMQGTIIAALSACLWGEITIRDGGVEQTNFDTYRVARMHEAPKILDIDFIRSDRAPGGLREAAMAAVQPAVGNAIYAACGKRCRTLPFTPENIKGY